MRYLIISLWLTICGPALATPPWVSDPNELKSADQALARQDYAKAHAAYLTFSGTNPMAQFILGLFERDGWGRQPNPVKACQWFDKAAQQKIPAAEQFVGDCFAKGIGRQANAQAAEMWYQKAAASGIHTAWCSAGELYIAGQIVGKDVQRGLDLCTQAAQSGSPPAMLRLADYYREGTQVPQDLPAARSWYQQAAEQHDHRAQYVLGLMLSEGQGGEANPSQALAWLELAASEGYAPAYLPLAILYANAKPDPETGALSPDILARIYVWNAAAKQSAKDDAQLAQTARIEALVLAVMPLQWKPDLDRQVASHLAKHVAQ